MPSRDYLIRQIEEMGVFLAILMRRILKMKELKQQDQMESVVREALIAEMKLDLDQVIVLENQDFLIAIKEHFSSEDQLNKLADILSVLGQDAEHTSLLSRANYLRKAYFLYGYLQETSSIFSYERRMKILELQSILNTKGLLD